MATELKMPALSPTMEKGTLAKWLVKEGDTVQPGDLIAEIETDKATMEFEAIDDGIVTALVVPEGTDDVAVGTVIALIGQQSEVAAARVLEPATAELASTPPPPPAPVKAAAPPPPAPAPAPSAPPERTSDTTLIDATPLARRIAAIEALPLLGIVGSGPRGRILKADLGLKPAPIGAPASAATIPVAAPSVPDHAPLTDIPFEVTRLSGMRKTIARRLAEAKQTVPHFYLTAHCRIDALLALRAELNASLADQGIKLSVNDLVIKAMAVAMKREPEVNVRFGGEEMYHFGRVDIAMAVAIDGGLITPVIRGASDMSLSAIAGHTRRLAEKARAGKLMPEDYQGGTASISNLGMYGIDEMIPVINPPQALILGVGSASEKPWNVDCGVGLATIMTTTASFDHRAIDGAAAARFMATLRQLIEQPFQIVT